MIVDEYSKEMGDGSSHVVVPSSAKIRAEDSSAAETAAVVLFVSISLPTVVAIFGNTIEYVGTFKAVVFVVAVILFAVFASLPRKDTQRQIKTKKALHVQTCFGWELKVSSCKAFEAQDKTPPKRRESTPFFLPSTRDENASVSAAESDSTIDTPFFVPLPPVDKAAAARNESVPTPIRLEDDPSIILLPSTYRYNDEKSEDSSTESTPSEDESQLSTESPRFEMVQYSAPKDSSLVSPASEDESKEEASTPSPVIVERSTPNQESSMVSQPSEDESEETSAESHLSEIVNRSALFDSGEAAASPAATKLYTNTGRRLATSLAVASIAGAAMVLSKRRR